jgi:hypothetical protein
MIPYVYFGVSMHGLQLKNDGEVEALRAKIEEAIRPLHPGIRFDSDVEVETVEHAGLCEPAEDAVIDK